MKDKRSGKNGVESLIRWRDFPLDNDDTLEPITNLPGSEHMIDEFNKRFAEEYTIKTAAALEAVIEKHCQ